MRILFLTNLCPPYYLGGYEIACLTVANAMHARGHEILLLTTPCHVPGPPDPHFVRRCLSLHAYDPYGPSPGAAPLMLLEGTCSNLGNTNVVIQTLREFNPDVVYCWNPYGIGAMAIFDLLNVTGVPWVFHMMDNLPALLALGCPAHIRHIFNAGDRTLYTHGEIITVSFNLLDEVEAASGMRFHEVAHLIPCWVDSSGLAIREHYRVGGITRFVSAGTLYPHKGIDLIIEAAASLKARGISDFVIDIYGEGLTAEYIFLAHTLQVSDLVRFQGGRSQRELLDLYAQYDAFLFPTMDREPFGFVPIEAAACGCVAIVNRNAGVSERLVDNVHCIKFERRTEYLTNAMASVISGEVDLHRIGKAGAALVRSDLSFGTCMDQIEAVLANTKRAWAKEPLFDVKLTLLAYIKHHLARSLLFGNEG